MNPSRSKSIRSLRVTRVLDAWANQHGVTLRFIRPGRPVENAYIERFNGELRDECLNEHRFVSMADAHTAIEAWRLAYNTAGRTAKWTTRRRRPLPASQRCSAAAAASP